MGTPDTAAMKQAIIDGDKVKARELAEELVKEGGDLVAAAEQGFIAGIRAVGELWEEGEYFLPELVQGAEAMTAAMDVVRPALAAGTKGLEPKGRVVIGTVAGDLHDIGKGLVATLLAANGFEVHDLGADVPVEAFVEKAREVGAQIVGASALLTTTMTAQRALVEAIAAAGLDPAPRVLVGGAPCTPAWAEEIGAAFGETALQAVAVAEEILR